MQDFYTAQETHAQEHGRVGFLQWKYPQQTHYLKEDTLLSALIKFNSILTAPDDATCLQ